MPASSSMIRTVPGANVGPAGGCGTDEEDGVATGFPLPPDRPMTTPMPTTSTRTSSEMPTIQPVRLRLGSRSPDDRNSVGAAGGRVGGASTGEDWTATPGPAGVATSDQDVPLHHRTIPAVPSGSGYQPGGGAGCAGPVTAPP